MNKKLIKKYKVEFDHWLNGGKLQAKFVSDPWEEAPEGIFSYSAVNFVLVIDDEYVEFRRALAEGKTIQYYVDGFVGWQDVKSLNQSCMNPASFRIKPEEPKFKVGDWVKILTFRNHVPVTIKNIEGCRYVLSTGLYADDAILELWQPKPGEFCWFWNKDRFPTVAKLTEICNDGNIKYFASIPNQPHPLGAYYKNCEPFIGQLPTYLRK